jgi:hypothetical protein
MISNYDSISSLPSYSNMTKKSIKSNFEKEYLVVR